MRPLCPRRAPHSGVTGTNKLRFAVAALVMDCRGCTRRHWCSSVAKAIKGPNLHLPAIGQAIRENAWSMKAARVLRFGPPSEITNDDVPQPEPGAAQLLVRVKAAGVGNWDASSVRVRLNSNPCLLSSVPSYQESSKQSDRKFRDSRSETKYTGQRTSNSAGHTQNMRCL